MLNEVEDAKKRIKMLKLMTEDLDKNRDAAKLKAINKELAMLEDSIDRMETERDAANEQYAKMNQEDAVSVVV